VHGGAERAAIVVLQGFSVWAADTSAARLLPEIADTSLLGQRNMLVCRANGETGATGLEPATSGVTGRRSNQLNYAPRAAPL
jgi:hypothetical protein